jgi:hypothetical protein
VARESPSNPVTNHLLDSPEMTEKVPEAEAQSVSALRLVGRPPIKPSVDDPRAIERVLERLIGGMGMEEACSPPDCPSKAAVYLRMARDAEFATVIARAREAQQHAIIDQTVDMADAATLENWQVVRLQIWARQWRAGKLAPRIYGERVNANVTGEVTLAGMIAASFKLVSAAAPPTIEGQPEEDDVGR